MSVFDFIDGDQCVAILIVRWLHYISTIIWLTSLIPSPES